MSTSAENLHGEDKPNMSHKGLGSDSHGDRVFPSASRDHGDGHDRGSVFRRPSAFRPSEEEGGVEVVLEGHGKSTVVDESPARHGHDQNVFRPPRPVRPRALRAGAGPPPPPHVQGSGSYGYGSSPHPSEYAQRPPYSVPYNPSGSFEESPYYPPSAHYSPHIQYPTHPSHRPDDVNIISPNHKIGLRGPPPTPRSKYPHPGQYSYPPTSPVSRPDIPASNSPPRVRNYAMRREGPYSAATRGRRHPEDGTFSPYATPTQSGERPQPPLVTESSFDSDHYSAHHSHASHPTTPSAPHYGPPGQDQHRGPYYGGGSFGSFDSHAPHPPPPHFDDHRYYGRPPVSYPPESAYSQYSYGGHPPNAYSPGGYHDYQSPHPDYGRGPHSYDQDDPHRGYYGQGHDGMSPGSKEKAGMVLPKAASEIDFEVTDPPTEPITPSSKTPVCESPADVNGYDVLCGRGGGTNSQIGNRRFRKLVQEFQPTYLLARRKEKPLLARTIVLIIRKRGGRFLKKDEETGELYEVGDVKAEAKTSQALREGLDVRATKNVSDKRKKKKGKGSDRDEDDEDDDEDAKEEVGSPRSAHSTPERPTSTADSPPIIPQLAGEEQRPPVARPPSPEHMQFRKRRRMRSGDKTVRTGCFGGLEDKLFSEFCPPRANIGRAASPPPATNSLMDNMSERHSSIRRGVRSGDDDDDDDIRYETSTEPPANSTGGCAGIALDIVTGAASGSFCLGPRKW